MIFKTDCPETDFKQSLPKFSLKKVTVQKPIPEIWIIISNQMIKYQLPRTRFDTSQCGSRISFYQ